MKLEVFKTINVYVSNEYSSVNQLPSNRVSSNDDDRFSKTARNIFKRRVENIKKSIEKRGYDMSQPIQLWKCPKTKKDYLVDGISRFTACKELGLPFYFVYVESFDSFIDVEAYMFQINNDRRNWTIEDKILHFINASSTSLESKGKLLEMVQLRDDLGISLPSAMVLYFNTQGGWKPENIEKAIQKPKSLYLDNAIAIINATKNIADFATNEKFILGVNNLVQHPEFSPKVADKIVNGLWGVVKQNSAKTWAAVFHNIANKGCKKGKLLIDLVGERGYKGNRP